MPTLLERAIATKDNRKAMTITQEDIELALAWAGGKIGITEVSKVKSLSTPTSYTFLARCLRIHIRGEVIEKGVS